MSATITRHVTYRACSICGKPRVGRGATGWPPAAEVCPRCSDTVRQALALGVDKLSPGVGVADMEPRP